MEQSPRPGSATCRRRTRAGRAAIGRICNGLHWPLAALIVSLFKPASAAGQHSLSVFGGVLTDNAFEEVLIPRKVDPQRPGLVGVAASWPLSAPVGPGDVRFEFAVEVQIVRHFGLQSHWEVNLPVSVGYVFDQRLLGLTDRVAFGIGPSYASRPPRFEAQRGDGRVEQVLVYWYAEVERNLGSHSRNSLFMRLHHRSDAFGWVGEGASSNSLVFGLRGRF